MAKYRETPCAHYLCKGPCAKGHNAEHNKLCQHCDDYRPRARVRHVNKKKLELNKERLRTLEN